MRRSKRNRKETEEMNAEALEPPKKKAKTKRTTSKKGQKKAKTPENDVSVIGIDQVDEYSTEFKICAFLMEVRPEKANKKGSKFIGIKLGCVQGDTLHTMMIFVYPNSDRTLLQKASYNTWFEVHIDKLHEFQKGSAATCNFFGVVGPDTQGRIKQAQKKPIELDLDSPTLDELLAMAAEKEIVSVCGLATTNVEKKAVKINGKDGYIGIVKLNVGNKLAIVTNIWNPPSISTGDAVQITRGIASRYNGQLKVEALDYIVNADNEQTRVMKKWKAKSLTEPQRDYSDDYKEVSRSGVKKLHTVKEEFENGHVDLETKEFVKKGTVWHKKMKTRVRFIKHMPRSTIYTAPKNRLTRLTKTNKGWKNADGKLYKQEETRRVFLEYLWVHNTELPKNGVQLQLFDEAAKKVVGLSANEYEKLSVDQRRKHWEGVKKKKYEFWIDAQGKTWKNKPVMQFMVDDVMEIDEEEMSDEESENEEDLDGEDDEKSESEQEEDEDLEAYE